MNRAFSLIKPYSSKYSQDRCVLITNQGAKLDHWWRIRGAIARNCADCSKIGFHTDLYDRNVFTCCPLHGKKIESACPACKNHWAPLERIKSGDCEVCGVKVTHNSLAEAGAFTIPAKSFDVFGEMLGISTPDVFEMKPFDLRTEGSSSESLSPWELSLHYLYFVMIVFSHLWNDLSTALKNSIIVGLNILSSVRCEISASPDYRMQDILRAKLAINQAIFPRIERMVKELCVCPTHHRLNHNTQENPGIYCPFCSAFMEWSNRFLQDVDFRDKIRQEVEHRISENFVWACIGPRQYPFSVELPPPEGEDPKPPLPRFFVSLDLIKQLYTADLLSGFDYYLQGFFANCSLQDVLEEDDGPYAGCSDLAGRSFAKLFIHNNAATMVCFEPHLDIEQFEAYLSRRYGLVRAKQSSFCYQKQRGDLYTRFWQVEDARNLVAKRNYQNSDPLALSCSPLRNHRIRKDADRTTLSD